MLISELARKTGVAPRMLRYYEEQGLICPKRLGSGYRDYSRGDQERLAHIQVLQNAGMTLATIRLVLPALVGAVGPLSAQAPLVMALREQRWRVLQTLQEQQRALAIIDQYLSDAGQVDVVPVANEDFEHPTQSLAPRAAARLPRARPSVGANR